MKSAIFYGKNDIRIEEVEKEKITNDEVRIKVEYCGVCGTDVHIYHGAKGSADVTKPTVLGHEFSGTIVEVGSNVTSFKLGDRVCVDPNLYCGMCNSCRNGLTHYCENMTIYGITVDGGFKEYCNVNERAVYKLGNKTSFRQGAMVEPLGCCLHGIDMCDINPGSQVVIIGGGMIGLLMLQLVKLKGAAKVALIEPVEEKREMAKKLGVDICMHPSEAKEMLEKYRYTNVSTVIECVGRTETIESAIDICGNKGLVMMFGLTDPDAQISIKPFEIFKKELTIKSSFINPLTQQRALDLIDAGKINVTSMVHRVVDFNWLEKALNDSDLRSKGKILVSPSMRK